MFKILQAKLQQYMNHELPDVQAGFRKGRGTRDQIANIYWIIKKHENSRKTSTSALSTRPRTLTVWITTNCEMGIPDHLTCLLRNLYAGQEETELDVEQQTDSKSGKEYIKAVYCHPAYLTYMQSTIMRNAELDEAQAGIKIARRNINNFRYADDITLWQKAKN